MTWWWLDVALVCAALFGLGFLLGTRYAYARSYDALRQLSRSLESEVLRGPRRRAALDRQRAPEQRWNGRHQGKDPIG